MFEITFSQKNKGASFLSLAYLYLDMQIRRGKTIKIS